MFINDGIAQMVEWQTAGSKDPGSNPTAGNFLCAMLQHVARDGGTM